MSHHQLYMVGIGVLGGSWILVYVQIIRLGFRDHIYGMPIVAFCGNIAWEFQFAFVTPYDAFQRTADTIWFILDLFIAWTIIRYGAEQFPGISRRVFHLGLAAAAGLAYWGIFLMAHALGTMASIYTGFGDTLLMEALFIPMALGRRSMKGQSLSIGYLKLLGTPFGCAAYYFFDSQSAGIAVLGWCAIAIFICDAGYVAVLHLIKRLEAAQIPGEPGVTRPAGYQLAPKLEEASQ